VIRTRQLVYRYPQGPALEFPDVDVPQGSVLLLAGPSGSGKSTWLALAAGLVAATSGLIEVAGQSLGPDGTALKQGAALDAWRACTIGFLPQKLHLSSALSVHDNLAMAQWAAGQDQDEPRITEALSALGVQDLAQRKPAQLSGGQALDDEAAAASLALLQATAGREGATLVIATHDARVAGFFADNSSQKGLQRIFIGHK